MANPIQGIGSLSPLSPPATVSGLGQNASTDGKSSFQNLLIESLAQTGAAEQSAQAAIQESLAGGDLTQVEVFSAMKKADLSLRMMLQIRNKVMAAFNEIKELRM